MKKIIELYKISQILEMGSHFKLMALSHYKDLLDLLFENQRMTPSIMVIHDELAHRRFKNSVFHGFHEFFYQIKGENHFSFPSKKVIMRPGELMLIPAGLSHGEKAIPLDGEFQHLVITPISDDILQVHTGIMGEHLYPNVKNLILLRPSHLVDLKNCLSLLIRCQTNGKNSTILKSGVEQTVLGLIREAIYEGTIKNNDHSHDSARIRQIKSFIAYHLSDTELDVSKIADSLGLNSNYLSNIYSRETGIPLITYIREQRLTQALTFLAETELTTTEVALSCGFQHTSYFCKLFKEKYCTSPGQWRRQLTRSF